ncbi:sugar phosphate isomerase/epimerase [Blastopirellula marina]|uniref:AP endonuclease n=2 Tax=Blastopirellula marina TaxID=124 RepID=A0A2S8F8A8_9BACT|nr:AP endonuclease [Blastopirellula marina]PTL41932.1 sugar phosphate isomerase/epimerase [Blastopirellula marina]
MPLGFVSAIIPEADLEQVFATAAAYDYECVEVACWPAHGPEQKYSGTAHIDVAKMNPAYVAEIQHLMHQYEVQISALAYYPNPLSPVAEEAEVATGHIRRVIAAAAELGIGQMNTFIGRDPALTVEANWPRMLETWGPLVEYAEQHQVKIGIENCPMLFNDQQWPGGLNLATTPAIWRRLFQDLPSPALGLNFDPSHLVWQQIDYLSPLREFASRLFHVHAKDTRIDWHALKDAGIFALPTVFHADKLPGLGDVDWGSFIATLGHVGYRGPICVEVEDATYEGSLDDRYLALKHSSHYLRNYIPRRYSTLPTRK